MTSPIPDLVGMVHLLPLPGSPSYGGSMDQVLETAVSDAQILTEAGMPALMVENFGDAPFFADDVPSETVAALALTASTVAEAGVPIGVNVLRNDGLAALGIASSVNAGFIRVNVLAGLMHTDQGPIVGRSAEIARKRVALCPDVEVWADVMVKHATPPEGLTARQAALDTFERAGADAIVVSGSGTGSEPDMEEAKEVRAAVPEARIVIGSGASASNLPQLIEVADTVIVGSDLKVDGIATNRPDPERTSRFMSKAIESGLI